MKGYLLSVEFRFNSNWCQCVTLGYSVTIGYDNDDNLEILSCLITQISAPPTHQLTAHITQSPSPGLLSTTADSFCLSPKVVMSRVSYLLQITSKHID